ncbi:Class II abasic (AP) endonuclease [Sorochytrium milnesiophthora]
MASFAMVCDVLPDSKQDATGAASIPQLMCSLQADILCCQETKLPRSRLSSDLAIFDDYLTFYSCCRATTGINPTQNSSLGYSGVLTCMRKELLVRNAQDGMTGLMSQGSSAKAPSSAEQLVVPPQAYDTLDSIQYEMLQLDAEGRCMITDHGLFVLFNLYCPNQSEDRLDFKLDFHRLLDRAVRYLADQGRAVMVVGDINVAHTELDHCDPATSIRDNKLTDGFGSHPSRRWLGQFLQPAGPMVDLFRLKWPQRAKAYTCWNTLTGARKGNYGTRIDYVLVTPELVPLVKECDIMPQVYGSDHCPVYVELVSTAPANAVLPLLRPGKALDQESHHEMVDLRTQLLASADCPLPACCSVRLDEFSKRQAKVSHFFKSGTKPTVPASPVGSPASTPKKPKSGGQARITSFLNGGGPKTSSVENATSLADSDAYPTEEDKAPPPPKSSSTISSDWSALFGRREVPQCYHKEACTQYTVNKNGPNKGRKFWLCSRPVGEGSKTSGRKAPLTEWRCDYFAWDKGKGTKRQAGEDSAGTAAKMRTT